MSIRGADLVVRHLEAQGVRHVFGVPGAKIDRVYDALLDSRIQPSAGTPAGISTWPSEEDAA